VVRLRRIHAKYGLSWFVDHPLGEIKDVFSREQVKLDSRFTVNCFIQGLESIRSEYLIKKVAATIKVLM